MKEFCFFVNFFSGQIPEGVLIFCIFLLQSDLWRSSDFFFYSGQIPERVQIFYISFPVRSLKKFWFFIYFFWSDPWKSSDFFPGQIPVGVLILYFFPRQITVGVLILYFFSGQIPERVLISFLLFFLVRSLKEFWFFIFLFRSDPWKSFDFFFFSFLFFLSDPWRSSDFLYFFSCQIPERVFHQRDRRGDEALPSAGSHKRYLKYLPTILDPEIPTYHPGSWNTYHTYHPGSWNTYHTYHPGSGQIEWIQA